ncbi:general transcription factor II-I repeat domain-containing protein 2B-like [Centruroides sculpturatus]|uniref:general transcription factor II-I repeat domain-containing protein 2B-like n=3 Tax=Arachnida TaxID=6854 RepID=UPI000C6D1E69|nr:general transcription factor II-I repeat domain-containing protein 2B-like [Centruroides sculpturatus]XP_023228523.1 general transcription factor II-I repeat domain-containing protein 2B-like [Centruroides sculpturatus]XP_023230546.1 general transcription factor II-I repeat domain-containing protein 2B-like [Centruroides sculpturatus]XP_023236627.1 general transcription factor II-I repeat domain-containing protein 2B-like [Centruroides sculpturatus]XP_023239994.1 general transcription factor
MSNSKRRKLGDENRTFNVEWELDFFFTAEKDKMMCLLCNTVLNTLKKANANKHYLTHKEHKYFALEGESRKAALQKLKNEKHHQQASFSAFVNQNSAAVAVTYKIAHILGKRGKPFSDIEIIKECIVEAVSMLDPRNVDKYKQLPLSRRTVTDRQHELAQNVTEQLHTIIQNEDVYFSIALDESTDKTDSAQVLYFIRAITKDFQCYEELLALGTLTGRTRGADIFENFKEVCNKLQLNVSNLVSVCTDGAPSMRGKKEGFVALLKKENLNLKKLISFHCILHQQNLCAKSTILQDTLDRTIAIVNYIRVNAMRHREFRQMLSLDEETYSVDLPYYCKVRWLSTGQVLIKVLSLRRQILNFYQEQGKQCDLSDEVFLRNLAFLSDMMTKQNNLNICLQGETRYIYEMWQKIQAFRKKLSFFKTLLCRSEISAQHFPELAKMLNEQNCENKIFDEYVGVLDCLIEEYTNRFSDFDEHTPAMKLAFEPHLIDISEAPAELQMELIDLGEDSIIKSLFNAKKDPIEIWKNAVEYPCLREHARRLLSCFGSTYCCETTFSLMSKIKTNLRTQITDAHLEDQLKLCVTKLDPNIQLLSNKKQSQISH